MIVFRVVGIPAPQGSKRHVGKGRMVENSKKVGPWRESVKAAALTAIANADVGMVWSKFPLKGPLRIRIEFLLSRPKGHFGTGKNADQLKQAAPRFPASTPDIDKLVRCTFDALTEAGIWLDDSQVVTLVAYKRFCQDRSIPQGAIITLCEPGVAARAQSTCSTPENH